MPFSRCSIREGAGFTLGIGLLLFGLLHVVAVPATFVILCLNQSGWSDPGVLISLCAIAFKSLFWFIYWPLSIF